MKDWRDYQVDTPEGESGRYAIQRFKISEKEAETARTIAAINPMPGGRGWGCGIAAGEYTRLVRGRDHPTFGTAFSTVMSDTRDEIESHREIIQHAHGDVLVNGLGLGMVARALVLNPEVRTVTIIEKSIDVIMLVNPWLCSIAAYGLRVIEADALTWKAGKGQRFDCVWHDIWDAIDPDNLDTMATLHRKYGGRCDWQASWMRRTCEVNR